MSQTAPLATAQFIQRSIQRSLRELPALPDAVLKVVEETNQLEPSAANVERFVSTDQALASKVLRVVNSAYYGLSGQVGSLSQAVMILGMQQVRNLVLSVGALSLFEVKGPKQQDTLKRFWMHSFAAAAATQVIGPKKGLDRTQCEAVFVGGLLHDVGRLFLFANFTAAYEQVEKRAAASSVSVEEAEAMMLGIGHAEVGQLMAESWKLPPGIVKFIGDHEGPFEGNEDASSYCIHAADALTKHLYQPMAEQSPDLIHPVVAQWLGFSEADFEDVKIEVLKKTEAATALLQNIAA